ncbi:MAG: D-aminoacyl-tRNA deacylase [Anaerolineaceae bacterium]
MMRAVLQRVSKGSVSVDNKIVAQIGLGYVILLGIGPDDTPQLAGELAEKTAYLRVFEDDAGKMNRSLLDVGGEAIVVSQFTLYADTSRGRRPSFIYAAKPELAEPLVEVFAQRLRALGIPTQQGVFGAHMVVDIRNDGPVTILLELPQV